MAKRDSAEETERKIDLEEAPLKKYRIQLDFSPDDFAKLNRLVEELGLSTRAELFRNAIVALEWLVSKKETGYTITASNREGRCIEPEFMFLRNVPSYDYRETRSSLVPASASDLANRSSVKPSSADQSGSRTAFAR